jgi:hypothetical protein
MKEEEVKNSQRKHRIIKENKDDSWDGLQSKVRKLYG